MDAPEIRCIDCRAPSPDVETEYTLISSRFGWRLTRRLERDGATTLEWRCPACWARYKQLKAASGEPPSSRRSRS